MLLESAEFNPNHLCRDRFDIISHMHDKLSFKAPILINEMEQYGSHLLLCARPKLITTSPSIVMCGMQSASAQIFGRQWALDAPKIKTSGKPELEEQFAYGYKVASEHGWFCDETEGFMDTGNGLQFVSFIRYIRTIETERGAKMFACAGVVRDRTLQ